jgi:hypothetical protein
VTFVLVEIEPVPIEVTVLGRFTDVIDALFNAPDATAVTPRGTTADPIQPELAVRVVFEIINVPPPEQTTGAKFTANEKV